MRDVIKGLASFFTRKVTFWVVGLIGGATLASILGIVLILMIIVLAVVGGTASQESEYEGGGGFVCSPTGELDRSKWSAIWGDDSQVGVLKGYDDFVLKRSEELGIDPVFVTAIMQHESAKGHSNAIKNKNNPAGVMDWNNNWKTVKHFSTLQEGIDYAITNISKRIEQTIRENGEYTIEGFRDIYAPLGAGNDPNGLNANWLPMVNEYASNLGGFTMNCEAGGFDFTFDGDVSQLRQNVASVGNKWVGRTKYVFGGGRTASSIARGDFDCSSFVHWAYKQNGIDLGHVSGVSTETLNKMGRRITIQEVQVGDLIFWDSYKKDGHVGIYIGNGKWIGSQSSTGVAIVDFNNSYWKSIFSGHVRRLIED